MASIAAALLRNALEATCADLPSEVRLVPLEHWNESVFRFLLVRHIRSIAPDTKYWTEWNRVDLLLPGPAGATLVELKFFGHHPLRALDGRLLRMKGGPSPQNEHEFRKALKRLADASTKPWAPACGGIAAGFLVLAYSDPPSSGSRRTYGNYYDSLQPNSSIASVQTITERKQLADDVYFTCKLLEVCVAPAA